MLSRVVSAPLRRHLKMRWKIFFLSNGQKNSWRNGKMCRKTAYKHCKSSSGRKMKDSSREKLRTSRAECKSGWNVRWNARKLQRDAGKFKQLARALKRRKIRELWLLPVFHPTTRLLHGHHQLCYLETIFCFHLCSFACWDAEGSVESLNETFSTKTSVLWFQRSRSRWVWRKYGVVYCAIESLSYWQKLKLKIVEKNIF